tara:strand:+ start:419 stop:2389 length:1971 start_codon:yes stop_codon:yes gene_type:complete
MERAESMSVIKVAAAVLNQTPLDWHRNLENILNAIDEARTHGATLLCLPELCITGYGCEDAFLASGVRATAADILKQIIEHSYGIATTVGLPIEHEGRLYNGAAMIANGELLGIVAKQHLANDGLHYEPRWFTAWPAGQRSEVNIAGKTVPFGDLVFEIDGVRIGFEICEDAWVEDRPCTRLAERGVQIILNPSASHFAFGKHLVRQNLVLDAVRQYQVAYLYANLLGNEAGRAVYDGDSMIASGDGFNAIGSRFSYENVLVTTAQIEVNDSPQSANDEAVVESSFSLNRSSEQSATAYEMAEGWESSEFIKEEEFARAVALSLFDYMRKSRSRGFVISLSGGADSAAVTCLASLAFHFALQSENAEGAVGKLSYISPHIAAKSHEQICNELITCVYQGTRNSSDTTRLAAEAVADDCHASFHSIDVDQLVEDYTSTAGKVIGRELNWESDDLALQNIQARVRAPSVWMVANVKGALLLATSNRSEAAVGYTTMDGDTCGGIAPIAGIDKAFLRNWLHWMQITGPEGFGALPGLAKVNTQQPTAELRPQSEGQTDESDLMPYEVLDAIERLAIRDKLMPAEILTRMSLDPDVNRHSADPSQHADWIKRFFTLWSRNQWKRERFAPSFHVDDENLDPKTWCRFPILSGGFQKELDEL